MSMSPSSEFTFFVGTGLWLVAHHPSDIRMLYDFHSWQNGKRAGAVHATYMIYGIKKPAQTNGHSQQDEDVEMASSPPELAPHADRVALTTLSLVAEESLGGTRQHTVLSPKAAAL